MASMENKSMGKKKRSEKIKRSEKRKRKDNKEEKKNKKKEIELKKSNIITAFRKENSIWFEFPKDSDNYFYTPKIVDVSHNFNNHVHIYIPREKEHAGKIGYNIKFNGDIYRRRKY